MASFNINNVMFSDAFGCKLAVVLAFGSILVFQNPLLFTHQPLHVAPRHHDP